MQLRQILQVITKCPVAAARLREIDSSQVVTHMGEIGRIAAVKLEHVGNGHHIRLRILRQYALRKLRVLIARGARLKQAQMAAIVGAGDALEYWIWVVNASALIIPKPEPALQ